MRIGTDPRAVTPMVILLQGTLPVRLGTLQVTPGRRTKKEEEAQDHTPTEAVHRVVAWTGPALDTGGIEIGNGSRHEEVDLRPTTKDPTGLRAPREMGEALPI